MISGLLCLLQRLAVISAKCSTTPNVVFFLLFRFFFVDWQWFNSQSLERRGRSPFLALPLFFASVHPESGCEANSR